MISSLKNLLEIMQPFILLVIYVRLSIASVSGRLDQVKLKPGRRQ